MIAEVLRVSHFAQRRYAAGAHPAMMSISAGAIEHDIGQVHALGLALPHQQTKWLRGAAIVARANRFSASLLG